MTPREVEPELTSEQIEQIEKTFAGNGQDHCGRTDPIQATLDDSGLGPLKPGASMAVVEESVRNLALRLADADDIRIATVREAALKKLDEIGISAPGKLLDAALLKSGNRRADDLQGKRLFLREIQPHSQIVDGAEVL